MQKRFHSKVLWAAVTAFVVFVLKTYFGIEIPKVDTLVDMILSLLILFGVVNNPTDGEKI